MKKRNSLDADQKTMFHFLSPLLKVKGSPPGDHKHKCKKWTKTNLDPKKDRERALKVDSCKTWSKVGRTIPNFLYVIRNIPTYDVIRHMSSSKQIMPLTDVWQGFKIAQMSDLGDLARRVNTRHHFASH